MIRPSLSLATLGFLLFGSASLAAPPLDASLFESLYADLRREAPALDPEVLGLALRSAQCAQRTGHAPDARHLTVIDYSLPSTERRLWVLDLEERSLLFEELVSHGVNTGENHATEFSNILGSRQSSLGLFRTAGTYTGRNGHSLKLHGLEEGVNHLALERTIVMHGAWYVSEDFLKQHGRLGRSWGCPALDNAVARDVIETIKDGHLVFSYYPDEEWLTSSELLSCSTSSASSSEASASTAGR
jgi:hypothetical protein